jgi:hypothetical protein
VNAERCAIIENASGMNGLSQSKGGIALIGDKRLDMPKTYSETFLILERFCFAMSDSKNLNEHNARQLVRLNNEVYDKLQHLEDVFTKGMNRLGISLSPSNKEGE